MFSPGILHLDNAPPLPPAATGPNHKGFAADLDNFREIARGVVDFNRAEAQRRTEQYYTQLTLQLKKGSWVLVLREGMSAPEGDCIPNRKLPCKWAGPFRLGPLLRPGELADFDDSESSVSRPPPPVSGANSAPQSAPDLEWRTKYFARSLAPGNQLTRRPLGPPQKTPSGTPLPLTPLAPLHRQPAPPSPLAAPGPGATCGSLAGPAQPRSWTSTQPV